VLRLHTSITHIFWLISLTAAAVLGAGDGKRRSLITENQTSLWRQLDGIKAAQKNPE
jgi:hypothetical protein